jgi:hypothetical protein
MFARSSVRMFHSRNNGFQWHLAKILGRILLWSVSVPWLGWTTGVRHAAEAKVPFFTRESRPAVCSTRSPIQWISGPLSLGIKTPEREADHSPQSNVVIKNAWSYTYTPLYGFTAWCLMKHRTNFTFNFYLPLLSCITASLHETRMEILP